MLSSDTRPIETWPDLPHRIGIRLQQMLPPREARERLAPPLSYGRHFGLRLVTTRFAAVMILFYRRHHQWHIPFTLRPTSLKHHAGQISFPGGAAEANESPDATAVRELTEELGIEPDRVKLLGRLSSSYLFISNYHVTPCVAWAEDPIAFHPDSREVDKVIEIPLRELVRSNNRRLVTIVDGQACLDSSSAPTGEHRLVAEAPAICWGQHVIWGATALILGELIAILEELRQS